MDIFNFITLFFNGILAIFTVVLAFYSFLLYKETQKTRIQNETPQISIYISPKSPIEIELKVKNTSNVNARNIILKCLNNCMYDDYHGENYICSENLSKEISYLPVGEEYSFPMGYYGFIKEKFLEFEISFKNDSDEKPIYKKICIDTSLIQGILLRRAPEEKIAGSLLTISNSIKSLIVNDGRYSGLRVYPFSDDERRTKRPKEYDDNNQSLLSYINR